MHIVTRSVLFAALATCLVAGNATYEGKWKMNLSKSDFGESTVTFEMTSAGEIKATTDGVTYTVKTDGKDYPTPWGTTTVWKSVNANTWEFTNKLNGKVMETATVKLSADDKTLTMDAKTVQATGGTANNTNVYQRVSGGPGLAGKWKTKNVKSSAPGIVELITKGPDGITFNFVNEGATCEAKFDGKDYPATGAMFPAGWTCAVSKAGDNGLDVTWKKDGKPMYKSNMTAAGKTLTELTNATGSADKVKIVYDRQ